MGQKHTKVRVIIKDGVSYLQVPPEQPIQIVHCHELDNGTKWDFSKAPLSLSPEDYDTYGIPKDWDNIFQVAWYVRQRRSKATETPFQKFVDEEMLGGKKKKKGKKKEEKQED